MKGRLLTAMVAACVASIAIAGAQTAPAAPHTRDAIVSAARSVVATARYATLVTLDATGQPQARIVDPFAPEDDLAIWVATNPLSRKVGEIAADPRVTLLYFDSASESYVTVIGSARLVRDPAEKAKRWKPEWAGFYKDANRGDDYLLIRIDVSRLEVVAAALGMTNDPATWRPVVLDLRRP
ncbi:MAG: pyridoxamine 5'-phosphate oxidase family protein [Acidobacteriota bacterium]